MTAVADRHTPSPTAGLSSGNVARIGVLGGISGGLLGGGTGVVTVPALARATDLRRVLIHGTSTLVNVSAAIVGSTMYALGGGHVDPVAGAGLAAGGVVGAVVGARVVARISERPLRVAFIAVLLLTAAKLVLGAVGLDPSSGSAVLPDAVLDRAPAVVAVAAVVGFIVGGWSAAMGLGGGLLTVPAMVMLFGADLHTAEGTSLLVMLPNAIVGSITHIRQGTALPALGWRLALFAAPGAVIGALISLSLPAHILGIVFGAWITVIAVREIISLVRARHEAGH